MGSPFDPEAKEILEQQMCAVASKHLNPVVMEAVKNFFDSIPGREFLEKETLILTDIQKLVSAHMAYLQGDALMEQLNISTDKPEETEEIIN